MSDEHSPPLARIKGRGAASNREGRFESVTKTVEDDGWHREDETPRPRTEVTQERARSILSHNDSPDISFEMSINPYRGCEHGCIYCYARPSHAYLNLSAGIDFETRLFAKTNAAERLREELARRGHRVSAITIGGNTDPYQPIEKRYRITRQLLEVLAETRHPFNLITKNAAILRDLDLIAPLARAGLCRAFVSVTSLDNGLSAKLEPRASAPHRRLEAIAELAQAGVPTGVMVAPIIPMITDRDLEHIVERAAQAGATMAGYVLIRLPHEISALFKEWLELHFPQRAAHVMSLIRQMRGGKDYRSAWGERQTGTGVFAQLIARRFEAAVTRHGLNRDKTELDVTQFRPPRPTGPQGELF